MNGVEKMIGRILVDFGHDAGAGVFPEVGIEMAAEVELVVNGKFCGQAEDAAIAADEHGFGGLRESLAVERDPRSFHGHAEADAVTLPESVGFCAHRALREKPILRLAWGNWASSFESAGLSFPLISDRDEAEDCRVSDDVVFLGWSAVREVQIGGPVGQNKRLT